MKTAIFSLDSWDEFAKQMEHAADVADHEKRRPRTTKHDTTAFYNFRHKKRKNRGGKR